MPGTMRHILRTTIFGAVALALGACSQGGNSDDKSSGAADTSKDLDITTARREVFYWDVTTIFALTDGGYVFIDQVPEGITTLVDTPAQDLLILATFVEDEPGNIVGIASELEEFDQPVTPDGLHDATWTLKLTGRGTLIGHQIEHSSPEAQAFLEQVRTQVAETGQPWSGEFIAAGTIGPADNGLGIIVGGSGEFEGASGYFTEENVYRGFDGTDYDVRTQLTFYFQD
jgi:hypothetical protein